MAVPAALLLLAGCSAPEPANDTLPTAASTSASPTLEPLGPADFPVPDEAREQTEAGATSFVRYYVDLINRAQTDLDVTYLQQFSDACATCDTLAEGFLTLEQSGYAISGGAISIEALPSPAITGGEAQFVLSLSQAPVVVVDAAGVSQPGYATDAANFPGSGGLLRWVVEEECWQITQLTIA